MKAIICAAGMGRRMLPLTKEYPKSMLKFGEKTIIEHQLDAISDSGIKEVIIVIGHGGDKIKNFLGKTYKNCTLTYVLNKDYENTNNIYSVYLTRDLITDGMIFLNGDIVFHPGIFKKIVQSRHKDSFVVDQDIELLDDSMKVHLRDGKLFEIGKQINKESRGWAMGIYKLSQEASERYFEIAHELLQANEDNKNISFVVPLQILSSEISIHKAKVIANGAYYKWAEIDTPEDYILAKRRTDEILGKMIFSNYYEVAINSLREDVLRFAHEGIKFAHPKSFFSEQVRIKSEHICTKEKCFSFKDKRIFVIGAGKAAASMAVELENLLGSDRITAGIVISNNKKQKPEKIVVHTGDHPIPTERSVEGTRRILEMKEKYNIGKDDFIIALMSGGGSSLMSLPVEAISFSDKQKTIKELIKSGANVHEITVIKKRISQVKGGKLAQFFAPTSILSLILSDVMGNDTYVIASGPLVKDKSTNKEANEILEKYKLYNKLPKKVVKYIMLLDDSEEDIDLSHVSQFILSDNNSTIEKIENKAREEGIDVFTEQEVQGEASEVAQKICEEVQNKDIRKPTLFLFGGETTVTLERRSGTGGRNQEFVLACLDYLKEHPIKHKWCISSIGTDGVDYITSSTGGVIDETSLRHTAEKKINTTKYLKKHDSYNFLQKINSNLEISGTTGTNVCDIMIFYILPN